MEDQKVAAIGIKLRRWVTMHGVSVNVCPDMRYFDNIVPCGIRDKRVGSVAGLLGPGGAEKVSVRQFADVFLDSFCAHFGTHICEAIDA